MDGGTVWNNNLVSAVERCHEIVDSDEQITIDIITCSSGRPTAQNASGNSISNWLRYWELSGFYKNLDDIFEFKQAFPNVNYRYLFIASKPLASGT